MCPGCGGTCGESNNNNTKTETFINLKKLGKKKKIRKGKSTRKKKGLTRTEWAASRHDRKLKKPKVSSIERKNYRFIKKQKARSPNLFA